MGYGLRPVKGGPFNAGYTTGGFSEYRIDVSAVTYNCYTGDFMTLTSTGEVTRNNTSTGATPIAATPTIGVAVGYRYVDPNGTPVWSNKYIGSTSNTDAYAFIVDNPEAVFLVQADAAVTYAAIGARAQVTDFGSADASDTSGNSGIVLSATSIATTGTFALQIIGVPEDGENEISSTPNVLVKLTPGVHQRNIATGV
jgi:hypothetical protein